MTQDNISYNKNIYLEKIINIAEERKIPLTIVCENAGLAKNTIANWKRGSEPSFTKVVKLLKYLDISADELNSTDTPKIERGDKMNVRSAKEYIAKIKDICDKMYDFTEKHSDIDSETGFMVDAVAYLCDYRKVLEKGIDEAELNI